MPVTSLKNPVEQRRFLKFAAVGISGSVVDFGVFNLVSSILGVSSTASQAISFTLAVFNNFIWNRLWTYPETKKSSIWKPFIQFGVVNVIGLGIRTLLFLLMEVQMINLAAFALPKFNNPTIIGHNLTLALVILIVMLWNYFANRYWTFKEIDSLPEQKK
jgi:putative flippase GtrA